jgi:hypothetical protein
MSKIIGIDLGTTNSVRRRDGRRRAQGPHQRVRQPHDPLGGRRSPTRASGWSASPPAPAGDQPQEHRLLDQALHGPAPQRGRLRREARPLRGHGRRRRVRQGQRPRQDLHPPADLRVHPPGAQEDRRGLPGRDRRPRGHHRAGVLQRRPAPGDQGRRRDRGPQGRAHHQRAHRRRPRLRAGQEEREDRGLRPRRRHVRRLHPRRRRRRLRGLSTNGDTHLGGDDWDQALINFLARRVQEQGRHRPHADAMAMQRLKEAAEKPPRRS